MIRLSKRRHPYLWIAALLVAIEGGILAAGYWSGSPGQMRLWVIGHTGFWPDLLGGRYSGFPLQPFTMFGTYWLVHASPAHLLGNLAVIVWFAYRIGPELRRTHTLEIWMGSVLGGGVAFGLLPQSFSPMIGASGGVFGLFGAYMVIDYVQVRAAFGRREAVTQTIRICIAILVLSVLDFWLRNGVLAWQAHLGGFVTGVLLTVAIAPWRDGGTRSQDAARESPAAAKTESRSDPGAD